MAQHFRKYGFSSLEAWNTAKAEIQLTDSEGNTSWNTDIASVVYEIGHVCELWGTDTEGNPVCETLSPLYSVDVVWSSEPLASWDSSLVWPIPVGVSSMGYSLDKEYSQAYCALFPDSEFCTIPEPIQ